MASSPLESEASTNLVISKPPEITDEDLNYLSQRFKGYIFSQRKSTTRQWVWGFGIDISKDGKNRTWVCGLCIKKRNTHPANYDCRNLANAESHLASFHNVRDPSGKRTEPKALKRQRETLAQMSIATIFGLDVNDNSQQTMANRLIASFSKEDCQRRIVKWLISANLPFRTAEHPCLRELLEYLNPSIGIQHAHVSHQTVRAIALREFEKHKDVVAKTLQESPGQVHLAFDGWTSTNGLSIYGISAVYRDRHAQPHKLVLGLPEMCDRHTGENIAATILEIIGEYGLERKVGYFTADNASNNDTAMEAIGTALGFPWVERRVRCLGHIINLVVKALLFGQDHDAFERDVSDGLLTVKREHEQWRKQGPIGKLHNFCQVSFSANYHNV